MRGGGGVMAVNGRRFPVQKGKTARLRREAARCFHGSRYGLFLTVSGNAPDESIKKAPPF
jgi:hypothetical protein